QYAAPFAQRPVADLVVVLGKYDKLVSGIAFCFCPEGFQAMWRVYIVVYVSILVRLGEVFNPVEIGIIAPLFLSASYTKGMMKFVDPLGVHSESFLFEGID